MSYRLEFTLKGLPSTTNANRRKHWAAIYKDSKIWIMKVFIAVREKSAPVKALTRAKLTLIRHSAKCPDSDGLVSSFKHVIDGLVHSKVIVDDTYEIIGMPTYKWEKAPIRNGHITVIVEEYGQETDNNPGGS